ncbi:MAG: HAMP domain-containing protein [Candidatus Omnitrophica bacterium]|nr:HAMP domain-containing protein [Candidatus Omnitrophota bacterium]MBU1924575.1 HAMP domain-containing protein [Candidatus Omnitrophota bacterium]
MAEEDREITQTEQEAKGFKLKLRLSHKILALVIITIVFSGAGAIVSGIISQKRMEVVITDTVTKGYEGVFIQIEEIFGKFKEIAEQSVRETSGLIALEVIKNISAKGQQNLQKYVEKTINDVVSEVSVSVVKLKEAMEGGFNASLGKSSDSMGAIMTESGKSQQILGNISSLRMETLADSNDANLKRIRRSLDIMRENLEESKALFSEIVDENTIAIMETANKQAVNGESFDTNKFMSFIIMEQEKVKAAQAKHYDEIYANTEKEFTKIMKKMNVEMDLMQRATLKDLELETRISGKIMENLFETVISDLIVVQTQETGKAFDTERELSSKIASLQTDVPQQLREYGEQTTKEIDRKTAETVEGAQNVIIKARARLEDSRDKLSGELETAKTASINNVRENVGDVGKITLATISISMMIVASVLIFVALFLTKAITRPATVMLEMLKGIAKGKGDLTQKVNIATSDEIGELGKWFNLFLEHMRSLIAKILDAASKVSTSAEQFSSNAEEINASINEMGNSVMNIASGADVQVNKIEEVQRVFAELSGSLDKVTEDTKGATERVIDSSANADEGKKSVYDLISKIDQITGAAVASAQAIQELKNSSNEIGEIVNTITSFADQTNLLALNAAIEAARAGDAGRGFAVVAEEVRKLAEGSATAANKISALIEKIVGEIEKAVNLAIMEKEKAEEGKNIAQIAGKMQDQISSATAKAKEFMLKIQELVPQQLAATNKVMDAVKDVSNVANTNAQSSQSVSSSTEEVTASMQEMTSAAGELAKVASSLKVLVEQFKVK